MLVSHLLVLLEGDANVYSKNGFSKLVKNGNADDFAKAILTTDTHTKHAL